MKQKIGSFNCQYKINLTTTFYERNPFFDVACTQESGTREQLRDLVKTLPNFYMAKAFQDDPAVCAIRTKNRASESGNLDIKAGKNNTRTALYVFLRSGLLVVNVHLTSGNPRRAQPELLEIYSFIQKTHSGKPWLIIGDFNHTPNGFGHGEHIMRGPQYQGGEYLDWAMAGNIISISGHNLPNYAASDHIPWYVQIEF